MTRSTFLRSALFAALSAPAGAADDTTVVIENDNHRLGFNPVSGSLDSFSAVRASDQQFVPAGVSFPAFVIQYLNEHNEFHQIASSEAEHITVSRGSGHDRMEARFERLGHRNLDVNVEVRMKPGDPASYWSIAVNNRAGLAITDVQFPFLVVSYKLAGTPSSEALLIPFWMGRLLNSPKPQQLQPDSPRAWQFRPETQATWHYPGLTMAQFLAFYNDRAGILLSCRDASGGIKLIKAVHHQPGIRLGM